MITRLGRIRYKREYYYDRDARVGCSPLDEALGMTSEISTGVSKMLVKLSAHMPYEAAVRVYAELTRVRLAASTAWEHTQDAGVRARPALDPLPSQKETAEDATCVSIAMDGFMVNVRAEGWKEAKLGAVSEVTASGRPKAKSPWSNCSVGSRPFALICDASGWARRLWRQG